MELVEQGFKYWQIQIRITNIVSNFDVPNMTNLWPKYPNIMCPTLPILIQ